MIVVDMVEVDKHPIDPATSGCPPEHAWGLHVEAKYQLCVLGHGSGVHIEVWCFSVFDGHVVDLLFRNIAESVGYVYICLS